MEASVSDIKDRVRQFIMNTFYVPDPAQVTDTVSFLETGIVDSTGVLEIIAFLQTEFGVVVEDQEILPENLDSVSRIVAYVKRKTNGGMATA
jgi:acyl carrier protein